MSVADYDRLLEIKEWLENRQVPAPDLPVAPNLRQRHDCSLGKLPLTFGPTFAHACEATTGSLRRSDAPHSFLDGKDVPLDMPSEPQRRWSSSPQGRLLSFPRPVRAVEVSLGLVRSGSCSDTPDCLVNLDEPSVGEVELFHVRHDVSNRLWADQFHVPVRE